MTDTERIIRDTRAKTIRELDKKYNAYCLKKVTQAMAYAFEEAAKLVDAHLGPTCLLAKNIRALKK